MTYEDRLNQGILLEQMGNTDQALRVLKQLSREERQDYRVYLHLAYLYGRQLLEQPEEERNYGDLKAVYRKAEDLYRQAGSPEDTAMDQLTQALKSGGVIS